MKPGDKTSVKVTHETMCPFCGKDVRIGNTADGTNVVMHPSPVCREFDKLDPEDFLEKCVNVMIN